MAVRIREARAEYLSRRVGEQRDYDIACGFNSPRQSGIVIRVTKS